MNIKFLTKTARRQGQKILFFNAPFKFIPISNIAEIADKFTRNEILSPNEVRQIMGMKPVEDAKADELRNRNINSNKNQSFANTNDSSNSSETLDDDESFLRYVKEKYGGRDELSSL